MTDAEFLQPLIDLLPETIINGEHVFRVPKVNGVLQTLARCGGPCRLIVTRNEALYRKFGPCEARQ